jgi:hypothetical protein
VAGEDRWRLEQLSRHLLRPPIALDRLSLRPDGTVVVLLKTPWRDGTTLRRFELHRYLQAAKRCGPHTGLAPTARTEERLTMILTALRPGVERPSNTAASSRRG